MGHDAADTMVTPPMLATSGKTLAFLFCGIGDARNLLATLAFISLLEMQKPTAKTFHFTIVDHKAAVFARDLLIFQLLLDAVKESKAKSRETLVVVSFLFAAQVMPQWVYDRLQQAIRTVLGSLENTNTDVMGMFYIPADTRWRISRHLEAWQQPPEPWYNTASLRRLTREHVGDQDEEFGTSRDPIPGTPAGCENDGPDALGFEEMTVLLPHMDLLEAKEPHFAKIFLAYSRTHSQALMKNISDYIDSMWQPNVTLVDLDYENKREGTHRPLMAIRPHEVARALFGHIPATIAGKTSGVLNHIVSFFEFVANFMDKIRSRTAIEVVIGEMSDTFQRLRHGLLRDKQSKMGKLDPLVFPDNYDRIHTSNIP